MTTVPAFYETDEIAQVAINLFHGWGYNFYRKENQLRADDLMVRARVCEMLSAARRDVEAAESAYRREMLPPPSRERPRPDPDALHGAQALEAIGRELGALEGHVRALPVPENDRMTQRFRTEGETLARLLAADQAMVGQAEVLRSMLATVTGPWVIEHAAAVRDRISAVAAAIEGRRDLLTSFIRRGLAGRG